MRALAAILLIYATSCGFSEPDGPPVAEVDAPMEPPPPDATPTGLVLVGTLATGGGTFANGTVAIVDDGLEAFDRSCAATLCVTGGVAP